jgi:hypothetical protein
VTEWETFTSPGDPLVVVRCTRCFQGAGMYFATPESPLAGFWSPGRCTCEPATAQPSRDDLAPLVARAVRQGKPVTVRH